MVMMSCLISIPLSPSPLPPTLLHSHPHSPLTTHHHLPTPTFPLPPHHSTTYSLFLLSLSRPPPILPFPPLNPTYHAVSFKKGEHQCCPKQFVRRCRGRTGGGDASKRSVPAAPAKAAHHSFQVGAENVAPRGQKPDTSASGLGTARVARRGPGRRSSCWAANVWTSPASPSFWTARWRVSTGRNFDTMVELVCGQ